MKNKIFRTCILVALLATLGIGFYTAPVAATGEWYAEYFANPTLAGSPALTRYDATLAFTWGAGSPGDGIPADNFSARWTRDEWFEAGTYRFTYRSDDGVRAWVGDTPVIDDWRDRNATWTVIDQYIPSGVQHMRVEYYDHTGDATIQLSWERLESGEGWHADFYATRDLTGAVVLSRYDAAVDFDWGVGSPDPAVPTDNFSARWARNVTFEAGAYRFYASSDDGVRVYVDGQRVIDAWQDQAQANLHQTDLNLSAGTHAIVVEYYEHGDKASIHAWWERQSVPATGWSARFYDNPTMIGGPALTRTDPEINFDWGEGAPASWLPSDNFAATWTRPLNFTPGYYRFNVRADDGMRLWIDDQAILMDYWQPQDYVWRYRDWDYLSGLHTLRVEYYEGAGNARIQFWWEYAATVEAARAKAPSPTYGFPTTTTPSAATTPVAPAQPAVMPGPWQGEYFNGRDLTKSPTLTRTDSAINFDWGSGSPAPGINANEFAARWTGTFTFEAGRYRFTTTTDDGVRLYVDDRLILQNWRPMRGTRTAYADLAAGQHTVRVEYFEASQAAKAQVYWTRTSATASAPTATPSAPASAAAGPWDIRYYANATLSGDPTLTLTGQTAPLDFDWGRGSPDAKIPVDNFSAAFEQTARFDAGRYTFTTYSDDGVRLYVDGQRVIDSWRPMRGTRTAALTLTEGAHTIRLEYYERTGAAQVRLWWTKR